MKIGIFTYDNRYGIKVKHWYWPFWSGFKTEINNIWMRKYILFDSISEAERYIMRVYAKPKENVTLVKIIEL